MLPSLRAVRLLRDARAALALAAVLAVAGCASTPPAQPAPAPATTPSTLPATAPGGAPGAAVAASLPDGAGRPILLTACTSCHDLREVTKFDGYYDRAQWRDIVVTMVEYGAPLGDKEIEVLADYLVANWGRR